jgi:hypothetical protein
MVVWDRDDCSFRAVAAKDRVFSPRARIVDSSDSVTGSSRQFTNVVRVHACREFLSLRRSERNHVPHP